MAIAVVLLVITLFVILLAAQLFTNSVEWLGQKLGLNEGAVGSVLAAVGTALPETMIPIVAILFAASEASDEIGIGAILGAPFMLSTAAFAVTGITVLLLARGGGRSREMQVDTKVLGRDMSFFLVVYVLAVGASFVPVDGIRFAVAFVLLGLYGFYVYRTVSGESAATETSDPLLLARILRQPANQPTLNLTLLQFGLALALIIGAAYVFVENMETVADGIGVPALVLALILAPLATELPEKFNSIIWVRHGKDTLAMGNISGAMVFQSCIPVSVGILFTPWELDEPALISVGIALISTAIVYLTMRRSGVLSAATLARAGILYLGFVTYVIVRQVI